MMSKTEMYYEWLKEVKTENRLSFIYLGELIGYSSAGFSKAFRQKTLSLEQISSIAKNLDMENSLFSFNNKGKQGYSHFSDSEIVEVNGSDLPIAMISPVIVRNLDKFMMDAVFASIIDLAVAKEVLRITSSPDLLNEYANK